MALFQSWKQIVDMEKKMKTAHSKSFRLQRCGMEIDNVKLILGNLISCTCKFKLLSPSFFKSCLLFLSTLMHWILILFFFLYIFLSVSLSVIPALKELSPSC